MKTISRFLFVVFFLSSCFITTSRGQSSTASKKKHILKLAHDHKIKKEEYTTSDKNTFLVKAYTIDDSKINKSRHWFLKIVTPEGEYVNYADVVLKGHLKHDPSIPFKFMGPVFKLCSEGKYVIGFIQANQKGPWVLSLNINSFDIKDTITLEIEL